MATIVLLSVAIIPMVAMFDMGLRSASLGDSYDTARSFANQQLERAKSSSYEQVRNNYPFNAPSSAAMTGGIYDNSANPITLTSLPHQVPNGFRYSVVKRYKCVSASASSCTPPTGPTSFLANSAADRGFIEIKVTVSWGTSNSYSVTGVRTR